MSDMMPLVEMTSVCSDCRLPLHDLHDGRSVCPACRAVWPCRTLADGVSLILDGDEAVGYLPDDDEARRLTCVQVSRQAEDYAAQHQPTLPERLKDADLMLRTAFQAGPSGSGNATIPRPWTRAWCCARRRRSWNPRPTSPTLPPGRTWTPYGTAWATWRAMVSSRRRATSSNDSGRSGRDSPMESRFPVDTAFRHALGNAVRDETLRGVPVGVPSRPASPLRTGQATDDAPIRTVADCIEMKET